MKLQEQASAMNLPTRRDLGFPAPITLALLLLGLGVGGCKLPSDSSDSSGAAPTVRVSGATEAAAMREYESIGEAMSRTGRVARLRYVAVLDNYPGTRAAYQANLDLAREDYTAIEMKKGTARTNAPVAEASREFLEFFAYGEHAHPPMPDLQERYLAELHPMYFNAVKNIGTWQATLEYLAAYPDGPFAAQIQSSIESAILNPNASWEAAEILAVYREIKPERTREQQLAAAVESNVFQRLSSASPLNTLQRFLQVFPNSIYTDTVEGMIKDQLGRKITVYSDRKDLENIMRERPGTVDAAQAGQMLALLDAQQQAYQDARSRNSVEALVEFMTVYPESRYLIEAARRIEELKLASLSSGQRSRLQAFRADIDRQMNSEESTLASYDSRLRSLSEQADALQKQSRSTQTRSYDIAAEAREHRRQAQHDATVIKRIRQAMKRNPDLKSDLEARQKKRQQHLQEAARLEEEAKAIDREAASLKTRAAEVEAQLSALREEAEAVRVEALGKRNRLHHEYLSRLDEAWKAAGGSA